MLGIGKWAAALASLSAAATLPFFVSAGAWGECGAITEEEEVTVIPIDQCRRRRTGTGRTAIFSDRVVSGNFGGTTSAGSSASVS